MMQNELITKKVAAVGEEISHELGAKLVKDYQDTYANDVVCYNVGRDIMEQILAQPTCAGIRFYNALNEQGKKTLVLVGIDAQGENIVEFNVVNLNGQLTKKQAIVADRVPSGPDDSQSWGWTDFF